MLLLTPSVSGLFKWRQFEPEVILLAVGWYLRFSLSYCDVEELLAERGVHADHVTVWRWVQRYAPEMERRLRSRLNSTNDSWRVDETYIRVKGKWRYLYRAVDSSGATLDFLLSAKQDAAESKALSGQSIGTAEPSRAARHQHRQACRLLSRRLCNSKMRVFWRRTANIDRCSTSTTSWNRITGPSSAGSAPVNISGLSGELGARSPAMKRFI
jgi:transposase-like protein